MSNQANDMIGREGPLSPWDDPMVKAALKDGRDPCDIVLIDCPRCGVAGYYNQGSHFSCRKCDGGFSCLTEEELPPAAGAYLYLGDEYTLDDWDRREDTELP